MIPGVITIQPGAEAFITTHHTNITLIPKMSTGDMIHNISILELRLPKNKV